MPDAATTHPGPARLVWIGALIVAATLLGLGGWAATSQIDAAVVAPGTITTVQRGQRLQHLEGGMVAEVTVVEGERVEKGEVLVRLDPLQWLSDLAVLRERRDASQARVVRLAAERDGLTRIDFPAGLPHGIRQRETALFEDRRSLLLSALDILDQRSLQIEDEIAGLRDQATALRERLALQTEVLTRMQEGNEKGLVETNRVDVQRDLVIQIRASLGQVTSAMASARSDALLIVSEIEQARREYSERAAADLGDAQDKLSASENELLVIEDRLSRADLRAPASGRVQQVNVAAGDVIQPSQILMEIAPQSQDFVVTARVSPLDVDSIAAGQDVELRFVGYDARRLAPSFGSVLTVSDNVVPAEDGAGSPHFVARIEVDRDTLPGEIAGNMVFGLPVEVYILQGERSVLAYLADPILDALTRSFREVN
ncbi:HlyD family type I secretion periplasmic adaptor subunit [Anianabacter salinae]|uniref:HlyD family type I secretion periplasmic adaptor subunit n=1 Tax=Anianabacter salinae TaxID=2851023 RepID=UPI00225E0C4A|nr:HlyD family type I secretion periplasmic adaptor subunit [Anianabacter salinae]MBV0913855.1 HlyD family type I secretion periplasmic adaptor subunit [Anianabacter salinae]